MSTYDQNLIYAHFFFVDLVGLSKATVSTRNQVKKIEMLNKFIKECDVFKTTNKENSIKIATGDGMAIAFFMDQQLPLKLAIQLHEKINEYNKGKIPVDVIQIRIGLHSGNVYLVKDINNNPSVWGSGVILARRIMDLGDAGHILITERMAKDLIEISDDYSRIIHEIQDFVIKHDQTIPVYCAFDENFGNSSLPQSGVKQGIREEFTKVNKNTLYAFVSMKIRILDSRTMFVKHTRTYEIVNTSTEPIKSVVHGIGTDIKKSFEELKIKVYDENHEPLPIGKITMNYPYQKEFATFFNKPILKNETGRNYTLEYEVEEPEQYYENTFLVDCKQFELIFDYPKNCDFDTPILYHINRETEEEAKSSIMPNIDHSPDRTIVKWVLEDNTRGQTIRIKW